MAGIRKKTYTDKNGKQTTRYYIIYKDINGHQCSGGGYDTKKEALKHINDFEDRILSENNITLGYLFDFFFTKANKYAEKTLKNYKCYYNKCFKQYANVKYKKLDIIFLQNLFNDIETNNGKYAAQLCLKLCKAVVNYAIDKELISKNIFKKVDKIKIDKPDTNHLTNNEILKVLQLAKEHFGFQEYVIIYTFVGVGLREGELFALNKSDLFLDENYININKQFTNSKLIHKPKNDSSIRHAYFFDDLKQVLTEYSKTIDDGLLFPNSTGGFINPNNFRYRIWKPLLKLAKINKRVRIHDLRGTYIDTVLSSGGSPKFAQNNVGHKRNSTTMDIYARNNIDMIESALSKLNEIYNLGGKTVEKVQEVEKSNVISFLDERLKRTKKEPFGSWISGGR